jgi:hypothetical protein
VAYQEAAKQHAHYTVAPYAWELNVNFSTISRHQQLQTTYNHASLGPPHPVSSADETEEYFCQMKPFYGGKLILIGWARLPSG